MSQIRLQRSPELDKVLAFLRSKYRLLSEAEIIKMVLSERFYQETAQSSEVAFSNTLASIRAGNASKDADEVLKDVTEEVEVIRQKMYEEEKASSGR